MKQNPMTTFPSTLFSLKSIAARTRLLFGGPGVEPRFAARVGGSTLAGNPVEAADLLS